MDSNNSVSYEQVRRTYLDTMMQQIPLKTKGSKGNSEMVWDVAGLAAVGRSSIHAACRTLDDAPTVPCILYQLREGYLAGQSEAQLEEAFNRLLSSQLPSGILGRQQEVAIDATEIPYHGQAQAHAAEIRRGKAKSGTTHFHTYASAYIRRHGKRVTVAVVPWHAGQAVLDILQRLLAQLQRMKIGIKRLLLDRQFCSVAVCHFLQAQPFQTIMPVPVRSQRLRQLRRESTRSYQTDYTMQSPEAGAVTIPLYVVRTYLHGRYGKHGVEVHFFTVLGRSWRDSFYRLAQKFRSRFGIESSYRLMNQVRARTSSRDPKLRYLFVVLALLLINLWCTLSWLFLALPRRGGRFLDKSLFRFQLFCDFLNDAIRTTRKPVRIVLRPTAEPCFLNY